jgi:hypothetical protein
VRALDRAAHGRAEAAFRHKCKHRRRTCRERDRYGEIDLLRDSNSRCRVLPRLAAIAGARHLPAGAVASLATGHLMRSGARSSGAHGGVAGKQCRDQQDRPGYSQASHALLS